MQYIQENQHFFCPLTRRNPLTVMIPDDTKRIYNRCIEFNKLLAKIVYKRDAILKLVSPFREKARPRTISAERDETIVSLSGLTLFNGCTVQRLVGETQFASLWFRHCRNILFGMTGREDERRRKVNRGRKLCRVRLSKDSSFTPDTRLYLPFLFCLLSAKIT